ncbi:MAG TPA: amidohydrolase [Methanoculleus sp.]|nr:amidohydrolase [Methanoculleus sp.]
MTTEQDYFAGNASTLITGAYTGEQAQVQDIYIGRDGKICATGTDISRDYRTEADRIIDAHGKIALPGLVNTHTHAAMTLLRGYADDMHLQEWLSEKIWPLEAHLTGDDVYWGTRLACLEMIRSGTIAFNDMYFFMDDAARATADAGMKGTFAHGFIDLGDEEKREAEIRATKELYASIAAMNNPALQTAVGPHAPYTVSPEGLAWCAEFSREKNIGLHIHLAETEREVNDCIALHGMRPAALLDRCGCLTGRTVAAHCCWLNEDECRLLADREVTVSHNPVSNMKLAVGRTMPYHWLKAAGARVSLGTDGCSSNNNLDLIEEMKVAALLQKYSWNSSVLLPADEALTLATSAGARALRTGGGTLAPGEEADLILLTTRTPPMVPLHNCRSNIVYAASGCAVDTVFCSGRMLMHDRVIPGEAEILSMAQQCATGLVARASGRT